LNVRVYAVKANCNRLLDIARETFKENVADIYALTRSVSDECGFTVHAQYLNNNNGFWFYVKQKDMDGEKLPEGFIHSSVKGQSIRFSSLELVRN